MGLPRAIQAHKDGDLDEAIIQYQRAIDQGDHVAPLFQNYGALLRQQGKSDQALKVYELGLKSAPHDEFVIVNRANLLRETKPASSLEGLLLALRLRLAKGDSPADCLDLFRSAVSLLGDLGLHAWAVDFSRVAMLLVGSEPLLLGQILILLDRDSEVFGEGSCEDIVRTQFVELLERGISKCTPIKQGEIRLSLAAHDMARGELKRALSLYEKGLNALTQPSELNQEEAQARQKLLNGSSWNFGCGLLKAQELQRGWHLFDYGLCTPAEGSQRWQRALRKPFASSQLPIWRGESLAGRRILLLEEQAVGDVMMFLTLLPVIQEEAEVVDLMLGDRLVPIYRRSFGDRVRIWTHADALKGRFTPADYDYQCPIGSICQHRFSTADQYSPLVPILKPRADRSSELRQAYRNAGGLFAERLVGISWKGGGSAGRIREKSVSPDEFAQLLKPIQGVRFISLQYGKAGAQVDKWRQEGCDVIHDPRVEALRDMDLWLDQVAACDAVISVANTTIHGAGGLNLPTQCLLSLQCDWRWFSDPEVQRSYWYPSVGICRQESKRGWAPALSKACSWLDQGCPMPKGAVSTEPLPRVTAKYEPPFI